METSNSIFAGRIIPIWIMCILSLILIAVVITRSLKHKKTSALLMDTILLLGLFSFSYPIIRLIIGLFQASDAVNNAGEISSTLLWSGVRYSLVAISMGFIALHVSVIGWFVARRFRFMG